ncbi:MAG: addiction module protein [bacterium]
MTEKTTQVLKDALELSPIERANLVDRLLSTLDQPDDQIDSLWRKEVQERIEAHKAGKIRSLPLAQVLAKYQK